MYNVTKMFEDMYYIGASDRRLALFENVYPLNNGVSYNSYLITDEQTILFDTVDYSVSRVFMENIACVLGDRPLDLIVINHMEPDHCTSLGLVLDKYPNAKIYGTMQVKNMILQFHGTDVSDRFTAVKDGDTLSTGRHTFHFVTAPMVHWPEAMVTWDETEKLLFSADAFGMFGALSGNLYADESKLWSEELFEARRYYTNIAGRYGMNVQALLKKAQALEIKMLCPLHGPVIRKDLGYYIDLYDKWSRYEPEEESVVIFYGSIYGGTENAAAVLAAKLSDRGVRNIRMYDVSKTHFSYLVAEAFRCSKLVFAAPTKDAALFPPMELLLTEIRHKGLANRTVALIENGTWGPLSGKLMAAYFEGLKEIRLIEEKVTLKSAMTEANLAAVEKLAEELS
ncbi:MAG: FprA family A-type flavoprotein [Lachnospiraceae bacterium]|nr:FprA family A-type flavoprotein [Lachnospiraceae bacterium]